MFCSSSPDLILSNVCSIINPTEKYRNTVEKHMFGVAKTNRTNVLFHFPNSWFIYTPTQKFNLSNLQKSPLKSSKILFLFKITTYRTSYRQNPVKQHFQPFLTSKLKIPNIKNSPSILTSSLSYSNSHDTLFS